MQIFNTAEDCFSDWRRQQILKTCPTKRWLYIMLRISEANQRNVEIWKFEVSWARISYRLAILFRHALTLVWIT